MYERLLNLAEELNEDFFDARMNNRISHALFMKSMEFVSILIDEAEKLREKEIN